MVLCRYEDVIKGEGGPASASKHTREYPRGQSSRELLSQLGPSKGVIETLSARTYPVRPPSPGDKRPNHLCVEGVGPTASVLMMMQ
jgi:hypothetical protein